MNITRKEFIREYIKAINGGYAAIFAGAGLSRASGFVDWKELLRELADDISLDVDKENDLVALAQYYRNERGNRTTLNQLIIDKFSYGTKHNQNIEILAQLPIGTYWTTNYDTLLEKEFEKQQKIVDKKVDPSNMSTSLQNRDIILYKMHGDVLDPANAILTKDDYETYHLSRQLFITALQGDLVSKTFLFIGFSFEDPNLSIILSRIRSMLNDNQRIHYCILKRVSEIDYTTKEDFVYATVKQEHKIRDLQRYSINILLVDDYSEITDILREIKHLYLTNRIFVSGSAVEYGKWENAPQFLMNLSSKLISLDYHIVTGFGNGIGSYIISGALNQIMNYKRMNVDKYLTMRPKPEVQQEYSDSVKIKEQYHNMMISSCGIIIFVFGNKLKGKTIIDSDGIIDEFNMAIKNNLFIIPIGSTGYMTQKIALYLKKNLSQFYYLEKHIEKLMNCNVPDEIIDSIILIINEIRYAKHSPQYTNLSIEK